MADYDAMQATLEGLDPLSVPTPGESLTADPENPSSFEQPPVHTNVEKATEDMFMRLTDGENIDQFLDLMRDGVPVENIAQVVLFEGFRQGQFNPDLMLLMIEPTIYLLLWLADYANIDNVVLYPEGDRASIRPPNSKEMSSGQDAIKVGDEMIARPEAVSPSLLEKVTSSKGKMVMEDEE